jgi:hypothetical protein
MRPRLRLLARALAGFLQGFLGLAPAAPRRAEDAAPGADGSGARERPFCC